jgi:hypothetical protein
MWCGDQALTATFPELFSIARFKEASVANHVQFSNDYSGILILLDRCMIGRWSWSLCSVIFVLS